MTNKLPLTSDYVFKRIFGQEENKSALKDFLESKLDVKIYGVEINNPEIHTKIEQWLWLFIGSEEQVKKASKVNKEIRKINKKLASMSLSNEERNNYEFRLKAIRDEADALDYMTRKRFEQGLEKGIVQGIEKGQQQKTKEIVKRMLDKNTKIEDIIEFTGLTKEEVEEIKNEQQI